MGRTPGAPWLIFVAITGACSGTSPASSPAVVQPGHQKPSAQHTEAVRRAKVWSPTQVEAMDIKTGPPGAGSFPFRATVTCDFVDKPLRGHSLKFACDVGRGDIVKVKIGATNGEVFGEVAATRLLWALGFGADHMYPVRVVCRGCPWRFGGERTSSGERLFEPAVIERDMPGAEFDDDPGWSWAEIDSVDERLGGAPRAHRDALKLLAVFLQHTDNKTEQQRLLCLDEPHLDHPVHCKQPFLILDDVGLTFGSANLLNVNALGGANFQAWAGEAIWSDAQGCIGNLSPSLTGTLANPRISEAGRKFLADLLVRLSPRQIGDLFEVSRFQLRRSPVRGGGDEAANDDWVGAFIHKRESIVRHRCP